MKAWIVGMVLLASCGKNFTEPAATGTLALVSSGLWYGDLGVYFAEPLAVRVTRSGEGLPGIPVNWRVTGGDGEFGSAPGQILQAPSTLTDADGVARVFFRPLVQGL